MKPSPCLPVALLALLLVPWGAGTVRTHAAETDKEAFTAASLNGTWILAEAEQRGLAMPEAELRRVELFIRDGTYTFRSGTSTNHGTFTLDTTRKPAAMDIVVTSGPDGRVRLQGIVELTADGWRVCYGIPPETRPVRFRTSPDAATFLARYVARPGSEPGPEPLAAPGAEGAAAEAGRPGATAKPAPLRVLLVSGGCCHDYPGQDRILSEGLAARMHAAFTVVRDPGQTGTRHKVSAYRSDDWPAPYDVVVHNECFADENDPEWVERILKPHREGLPAVVIHCSMHSYRVPNPEWFRFVGVTSHRHGSHFPYIMTNVKPEHPVMAGFPPVWQTPREELYNIEKVERTATPLATGWSHETKRGEVNVWLNQYGEGRVFGTTIGHYNHTLENPLVLDLLARGLLWACDKLDADGNATGGYGPGGR